MRETNQTNKEIADQQHQDKQEEIHLKKEEACIVKVDRKHETTYDICLLYTSPSPRDTR